MLLQTEPSSRNSKGSYHNSQRAQLNIICLNIKKAALLNGEIRGVYIKPKTLLSALLVSGDISENLAPTMFIGAWNRMKLTLLISLMHMINSAVLMHCTSIKPDQNSAAMPFIFIFFQWRQNSVHIQQAWSFEFSLNPLTKTIQKEQNQMHSSPAFQMFSLVHLWVVKKKQKKQKNILAPHSF